MLPITICAIVIAMTRGQTTTQSANPSAYPSVSPSGYPSAQPSTNPTRSPTLPSAYPSVSPSRYPSAHPSTNPSAYPSVSPSGYPSAQPSTNPTRSPTLPSAYPSVSPSRYPSAHPSTNPTTRSPTLPSASPSRSPTSPSISPTTPTMAPTYYTLPFIFGDCATVYEVSLSFGGNVVRTLSAGDVVEFIDPGGHYDVYVGLVQITLKFNYNVTSHICDSSCCNCYRRVMLSVDDMYGSAGCRKWCFNGRYCSDSRTALAQTLSVQYRSDGSSRNINMGIDSTSSHCNYYSLPILTHGIGLIVATQLPTVSPTAGSNGPTNIPSTAPITPSKSPSDAPSSSKAPSDEPTMAPSPSQPAAEKAPTVLNTGLLYSEVVLFLWVAGLTIVLCCVMCTVFYCWNQWRTKALAHSQDIEHMNENGANIAPEIPMIPNQREPGKTNLNARDNDDDVLCVKQLEERVDSGLVEAEDVCDEGVDCNEFIEWMKDTVGLEEYTQMMMENGYGDVISLAFVTMDDLKEVGVTTIAHRRRIYFLAQQKCQQSVTNKNTNDHSQVETGGTRITGTGGAAV
eukprot:595947_1